MPDGQPPSLRLTKDRHATDSRGRPVSETPKHSSAVQTLGRTGRRNRAESLIWDDPVVRHLKGVNAIKTFERMALDGLIAGILELIRLLLGSARWAVQAGGKETIDEEFAEFVSDNVSRLDPGWPSTVADAAEFTLWGFQLFEVLFEDVDGLTEWAGFMPYDARTVDRWITHPETGRLVGVQQVASDGLTRTIPAWKLLHFRTRPTAGRPEGVSLARNAFLGWTDKQELRRVMKVGVRREITGMTKLEAPSKLFSEGASPEDKAALAEAENMVREVERDEREGIVMPHERLEDDKPSGWRLSLMSSPGRRSFDMEKIWNLHNRDIAIAMLADVVLLGHEERGSFALGSAKTNTLTKAIGTWLDRIGEHMEHKAIPVLRALNLPFAGAAIPKFVHGDIEELELELLSNYVKNLGDAGFITADEELEAHLRRRADLPDARGEEEL